MKREARINTISLRRDLPPLCHPSLLGSAGGAQRRSLFGFGVLHLAAKNAACIGDRIGRALAWSNTGSA